MEPYVHQFVSSKFEKRKQISEMAEVNRLKPFQFLNMVGDFAERFGQNPDDVYAKTSFETVANFAVEAKEKREFNERYFEAERILTPQPNDITQHT